MIVLTTKQITMFRKYVLNMTMEEFGKLIGVTRQSVCYCEKNDQMTMHMRMAYTIAICEFLNERDQTHLHPDDILKTYLPKLEEFLDIKKKEKELLNILKKDS